MRKENNERANEKKYNKLNGIILFVLWKCIFCCCLAAILKSPSPSLFPFILEHNFKEMLLHVVCIRLVTTARKRKVHDNDSRTRKRKRGKENIYLKKSDFCFRSAVWTVQQFHQHHHHHLYCGASVHCTAQRNPVRKRSRSPMKLNNDEQQTTSLEFRAANKTTTKWAERSFKYPREPLRESSFRLR